MVGAEPQRELRTSDGDTLDPMPDREESEPVQRRDEGDRRSPERTPQVAKKNKIQTARTNPALDTTKYYLPTNARFIPGYMATGYAAAAVAAWAMPSISIIAAVVLSLAFAALVPKFALLERSGSHSQVLRIACLVAAVLLPSFLFGIALGEWKSVGLGWPWAVASLVCINGLGNILYRGHVTALRGSNFASWAGYLIAGAGIDAVAALIGAAVVAVFIAREQMRMQKEELLDDEARQRIQTRAEDILRDYEETGQGWFWETDRRGLISYVSHSVARTLGKKTEDLVGRHFTELFELGEDARENERTLTFHLSARSSFLELAVQAAVSDEERWWSITGRPVYDSFHNFCGFRGSGTDLTEKRRSQQNASRLAHYDSLTGLANRLQMSQILEKILAAPLERDRECAVFLLDLDRFKHVNDTLGHPAGDALLKQVSQRLERTVGDMGRVGRLGGDEFKVILPGRVERPKLATLASEIISSLSQPYSIDGQRVVIGASVGIAVAPEHGEDSEAIIRNSDLALYAAKDGGRGRYHFYAADLLSAADERAKLERDLRDAMANGDLELAYQPVVSAASEKISGFEALLRWKHPEHGYMSPAKFVPVAEDAGLIEQIGQWALQEACRDLAKWPREIRCAVNVSPLQFANPAFPSIVANAIAHSGINPGRLELEITESVFLNDSAGTDAMFAALKRVGVRLALDDFGTGYSSLGYLKKAPFDKIKIDQSFVRGATNSQSRNGAIITSITSLAQALGMDTTAEGVETLDELELVRVLGCSQIQGHIYSKAIPASEVAALVSGDLTMTADGPRSAREPRQSVLRKVVLEHGGEFYNGTIRNISRGGAMVEGLWNVPVGTKFAIAISEDLIVQANARWSVDNRMGVEFEIPVEWDERGRTTAAGRGAPSGYPSADEDQRAAG